MEKVTVRSFESLHAYIQDKKMRTAIFRGVTKYSYQVIPSIGRCKVRTTLQKDERRMFKLFKEVALPYLNFAPRNDFEWMAVAQHHGLPTRLLDWTTNPLVAAYFSVEKEYDQDSAIYMYDSTTVVDPDEINSPFEVDSVIRYRPPNISDRIVAQAGMFTIHPEPDNPFEPVEMVKIKILNSDRARIKQILYKYGISRKTLFPGLESIASDIVWINTVSY